MAYQKVKSSNSINAGISAAKNSAVVRKPSGGSSGSSNYSSSSSGSSGGTSRDWSDTPDYSKYLTDYYTGNDPSISNADALHLLGQYQTKTGGGPTGGTAYSQWHNQQMVDSVLQKLRGSAAPAQGMGYGGYGNLGFNFSAGDYYNQQMEILEQQRAAEEAAIQARVNNAVSQNNAYIPQVDQAYADQMRQAYIQNQMSKAALPENMAAMGLSGGASESALLGVNTNYQNLRNESDQAKNNALAQIRQNEQNIRATGDASLSELAGGYLSQQMQIMQDAQAREDALRQWQMQYELQRQGALSDSDYRAQMLAWEKEQYAGSKAQQEWENANADRYYDLDKYSTYKTKSSGGSGGSSGGLTDNQRAGILQDMYDNGQIDDQQFMDGLAGLGMKISGGTGGAKGPINTGGITNDEIRKSVSIPNNPMLAMAAATQLLARGANRDIVKYYLEEAGYGTAGIL